MYPFLLRVTTTCSWASRSSRLNSCTSPAIFVRLFFAEPLLQLGRLLLDRLHHLSGVSQQLFQALYPLLELPVLLLDLLAF